MLLITRCYSLQCTYDKSSVARLIQTGLRWALLPARNACGWPCRNHAQLLRWWPPSPSSRRTSGAPSWTYVMQIPLFSHKNVFLLFGGGGGEGDTGLFGHFLLRSMETLRSYSTNRQRRHKRLWVAQTPGSPLIRLTGQILWIRSFWTWPDRKNFWIYEVSYFLFLLIVFTVI